VQQIDRSIEEETKSQTLEEKVEADKKMQLQKDLEEKKL
jgi:hypothetical protein